MENKYHALIYILITILFLLFAFATISYEEVMHVDYSSGWIKKEVYVFGIMIEKEERAGTSLASEVKLYQPNNADWNIFSKKHLIVITHLNFATARGVYRDMNYLGDHLSLINNEEEVLNVVNKYIDLIHSRDYEEAHSYMENIVFDE